jgi:hypothetical protein
MKIGVISDSHGKHERLALAAGMLVDRGAAALVHCGDIGHERSLETLAAAGVPAYVVSGNTDRHIPALIRMAEKLGVEFHWEVIEAPLGDGRFLVATHGHDERLVETLIAGEQFPYVCVGHSHEPQDVRRGPVRVINPGALHRAGEYTVALLDTDADELEFLPVPR